MKKCKFLYFEIRQERCLSLGNWRSYIMDYGIESIVTERGKEYFGYKKEYDEERITYLCHAYTEELCTQRLQAIIEKSA